jgi:hypothetical protein
MASSSLFTITRQLSPILTNIFNKLTHDLTPNNYNEVIKYDDQSDPSHSPTTTTKSSHLLTHHHLAMFDNPNFHQLILLLIDFT